MSVTVGGLFVEGVAIICDIDGTLADCQHRRHYVEQHPKDWNMFFVGMADDKLVLPVAYILKLFHTTGFRIVLCTGRSEEYREATEIWLQVNHVSYDYLLMRRAGDRRDDAIVKREMLDQIRRERFIPWLALDDRDRVVKMWRDNGVPCFQVAEGNF